MATSTQSKKKVLVLGTNGMLGATVLRHLSYCMDFYVVSCVHRFPSPEFDEFMDIHFHNSHFIINCIGAVPQKTLDFSVNYQLPLYLIERCRKYNGNHLPKIIHPSTDCEFNGDSSFLYPCDAPQDATDEYGQSKILGANIIRESGFGKVIRVSIIGLSEQGGASLLDWAFKELSQGNAINGYENHYWNGITVLEWSKLVTYVMYHYDHAPPIIQVGVCPINKAGLLEMFKRIFKLGGEINHIKHEKDVNKCLMSNYIEMNELEDQIREYRGFLTR